MAITLNHETIRHECEVTFTDGEKLLLNTKQLAAHRDLWAFPRWHCNAGADLLMISGDMTVYSCNSKNDNLGNLLDPNFSMLHSPTVCTKIECQPKNMDICCTKFNPSA